MSDETTAAPVRKNHFGDLCPRWCTANHDRQLIAGVFLDSHRSDPVGTRRNSQDPDVQLVKHGFETAVPEVMVTTLLGSVNVRAGSEAHQLAEFILRLARLTPAQFEELAAEIEVASAVLLEEG